MPRRLGPLASAVTAITAITAVAATTLVLTRLSASAAPAKQPAPEQNLVGIRGVAGFDTPAVREASALLFFGEAPAPCMKMPLDALPEDRRDAAVIGCMLHEKYARDPRARDLATALFDETGSVAGVGAPEVMNGGYRGMITLHPQLPTGAHRKHLQWVVQAMRDFDAFFAALSPPPVPLVPGARASAPPAPASPRFRWKNLSFRFVRSLAPKRTPSAYALGWSVTYNVRGSLLTSFAGVRDTLFHELFHLNDGDHADWSMRALKADYDTIIARCAPALTRACLAPYAPGTTTVRGGTYYAFQQDNGESVHEYAAELALRYFKEHAELLATGTLSRPAFKCAAPENARAYRALADEFFAGVDKTGPCK
jgi:hypothetical protein